MKALLDADVILYKCGFAAQHKWYYAYEDDDYWVAKFRYKKEMTEWLGDKTGFTITDEYEIEPLENALFLCDQLVKRIIKQTGATKYQLYLTGDGNYRDEVATILPYKGNRDSANKPHWYSEIKDYLIKRWGAVIVEGYEADDAMSMGQWKDWEESWEYIGGKGEASKYVIEHLQTVICTTDKDLKMVPGWHYNWDKDEKPVWITEAEGRRWFYTQLLMGDKSVDNIPGIKGLGPAKAKKILDSVEPSEYECIVGVEYAKAYDDPESAMEENARLLWMSRHTPNDWSWGV